MLFGKGAASSAEFFYKSAVVKKPHDFLREIIRVVRARWVWYVATTGMPRNFAYAAAANPSVSGALM